MRNYRRNDDFLLKTAFSANLTTFLIVLRIIQIMEQHMMDMENTKQYLSNLYENYLLDSKQYLPLAYRAKCLGAMEAILVILGVLTPGVPHNYQKIPFTFKLFWLIPITLPSKEGYQEYILRLAAQTLSK